MKQWAVIALALVGGYAVFQWFTNRQSLLGGGQGGKSVPTNMGPLSAQAGVGDYVVSPLSSGVPVFTGLAIANGHGDQVSAAYHVNPLSTLSGSPQYSPAFGPQANQAQPGEVSIGL